MAWVRTTVIRKRYEQTVSHNTNINLKAQTGNISWVDERVILNQHNFKVGTSSSDVNARQYHGLSFAVANPRGNNIYNTQIGIVKVNNTDLWTGLVYQSGNSFNPNSNLTIFSGTYYAFFFMVAFNNKYNGLTNGSGFEVYANNILIAQHYVKESFNYLNNFVVAHYSGSTTGNIEIRPYGNRNFYKGYETPLIHNLFIYTQPVTFYSNNATLIAIEGDM